VVLGALVVVVLAIGAALLLKSAKAVDVRSFTNEGDR
jgi:ABC-type proline/glycine betaine transport system permease subunit